MGDARDVYEEGALIFPAVQVQRDYQDIEDMIRMCRMRIRVPEQWWGDYLALLGAARIGERELLALGAEVGWDALDATSSDWFDYSEQRMVDGDPAPARRARPWSRPGTTLPGRAGRHAAHGRRSTVDPARRRIEVDLRDNPDCQPCGLNLTEARAHGGA